MSQTPTALVVCGSRREPSRTRELTRVAAEIARETGLSVETLDLREYPMALFDGRDTEAYDDTTNEAIAELLGAEIYFIASPIYFGGISGALKNLFDHIPYERFQERPRAAGLLATGRDDRHRLVVDTQLRATLVYLGVDVATTSVFATEADFEGFTLRNEAVRPYVETMIEETIALRSN